jgi:hypothetical protein
MTITQKFCLITHILKVKFQSSWNQNFTTKFCVDLGLLLGDSSHREEEAGSA